MTKHIIHAMWLLSGLLTASPLLAQVPQDPFPQPINTTDGVITVNYVEFASLPDGVGQAARMMMLMDEPGGRRLFVNDKGQGKNLLQLIKDKNAAQETAGGPRRPPIRFRTGRADFYSQQTRRHDSPDREIAIRTIMRGQCRPNMISAN